MATVIIYRKKLNEINNGELLVRSACWLPPLLSSSPCVPSWSPSVPGALLPVLSLNPDIKHIKHFLQHFWKKFLGVCYSIQICHSGGNTWRGLGLFFLRLPPSASRSCVASVCLPKNKCILFFIVRGYCHHRFYFTFTSRYSWRSVQGLLDLYQLYVATIFQISESNLVHSVTQSEHFKVWPYHTLLVGAKIFMSNPKICQHLPF